MAKVEQVLILDPPSELHFKPPFTDITTSFIKITNPTDKEICFKVKTTAPKTYCVRPNSGSVFPMETVVVAVMLQPFDLENADKTRHKFMVQSIYAPEGEYSSEALWRDTPPENFMNSKLKCVFDVPSEKIQVVKDEYHKAYEAGEPVEAEVKSSPPVQEPSPKPVDVGDEEIQNLYNTNKRLQKEVNELRQENSNLKEHGLRSRLAHDSRSRGTSAKPFETELQQMSVKPNASAMFSNSFVAIAIVIFLCGLVLGKFFL